MIVYFKEYDKLYSFLKDVEKFTYYHWSGGNLPTQAIGTLGNIKRYFSLGDTVFLHFDKYSKTIAYGSEYAHIKASKITINHKFFEGARI